MRNRSGRAVTRSALASIAVAIGLGSGAPAILRRNLITLFFSVVLAGFLNTAEAVICDLWGSTFGLQTYTQINSLGQNAGGCIVGGDLGSPNLGSPIFNEVSAFNAQAHSIVQFGINSASVSGNLGHDDFDQVAANAWSIWKDEIWITGGAGTGQVTFGVHFSGTYTTYIQSEFDLGINIAADGSTPNSTFISTSQFPAVPLDGLGSLSVNLVLPYVFTYDVPFSLQGTLILSGVHFSQGYPFLADFLHTAILDTVILPAGASLNSLSGASYPAQLTEVPEAATLALLALGLAGLGFSRRWKSVQA